MKRTRKRKSKSSKLRLKRKVLFKRRKRGTLTEVEYKQLKTSALKKFREESKQLRNQEFKYELLQRRDVKTKKGIKHRYLRIPLSAFEPNQYYQIWIKHKSGKKRILGIGRFKEIPTKSHRVEKFGQQLGGRTFNPKLKPARQRIGKWIPTNTLWPSIVKELESFGLDAKTEIRGAIIPTKRYFHTEWKIFSDHPLPKKTKFTSVLVNCAIHLIYKQENWIGKHSIHLDFDKPTSIKKLLSIEPKLEKRLRDDLEMLHSKAEDIDLLEINGYVPIGV